MTPGICSHKVSCPALPRVRSGDVVSRVWGDLYQTIWAGGWAGAEHTRVTSKLEEEGVHLVLINTFGAAATKNTLASMRKDAYKLGLSLVYNGLET